VPDYWALICLGLALGFIVGLCVGLML